MSGDKLKQEFRAVKEAKAILENQQEIGHTAQIEMQQEQFKNNYPEYRYLIRTNLEELEKHEERLRRDIQERDHGWLGYWTSEDEYIADR